MAQDLLEVKTILEVLKENNYETKNSIISTSNNFIFNSSSK